MARDIKTRHDRTWTYSFDAPVLDLSQDFRTQRPGRFSRLTGVDGRYSGRLRRFPGFLKRHTVALGGANFGGTNGVTLYKPFAIQRAPHSTKLVRGVFFLQSSGGVDSLAVTFSDDGGAVATAVVVNFGRALNFADISFDHQLAFFVGELAATGSVPASKQEKVIRYAGSSAGWVSADWITSPLRPAVLTTTGGTLDFSNTSIHGFLFANRLYGIAYRYVFPDQGWYGPLSLAAGSEFPVGNLVGGVAGAGDDPTSWLRFTIDTTTPNLPALGAVFSRCIVQVFRTVANNYETVDARGILRLEAEFEVPRVTASIDGAITSTTSDTLTVPTTAGLALGDTIYIMLETNDAPTTEASRVYESLVYRATVVALTGTTISISPSLPEFSGTTNDAVDYINSGAIGAWCVARSTDETDTSGEFLTSDTSGIGWSLRVKAGSPVNRQDASPLTPRGLDDRSILHQPQLEPEEFGVFPFGNPRARLIEQYDNIFVRVTGGGSSRELSADQSVIRWEFTERPRKGLVPVLNRYRLADLNSSVVSLVSGGTFIVGILSNAIVRIHRSGSSLSVDLIHNQHGASGALASVAINTTLYFCSPVGILVCDLNSGDIDVINATQHFFNETGRWQSSISSVQAAYDSQLGAVFFHNPTLFETLILWLNHGVMTHLIDVPFDRVATGVDWIAGGVRRALWFTKPPGATDGAIFEADSFRTALTRTTLGQTTPGPETYTYNGLAGAATNATTLAPPGGGTFGSEMIGHFIRFFNPTTGAPKVRVRVSGFSAGNLTFSSASPAPSPGDRFAVGGIPMQSTLWPIGAREGADDDFPIELFHHKKIGTMAAAVGVLSGDTSVNNPNLKLRYQVFTRSSSTPALEAEGALDGASNVPTYAALGANHSTVVPGVEQWASNLDIDLLGVLVDGTIETSLRSEVIS